MNINNCHQWVFLSADSPNKSVHPHYALHPVTYCIHYKVDNLSCLPSLISPSSSCRIGKYLFLIVSKLSFLLVFPCLSIRAPTIVLEYSPTSQPKKKISDYTTSALDRLFCCLPPQMISNTQKNSSGELLYICYEFVSSISPQGFVLAWTYTKFSQNMSYTLWAYFNECVGLLIVG